MSYICLSINQTGAVLSGDSRETFPARIHLDRRKKVFALPNKKLIWGFCGPTLRYGIDLPTAANVIFHSRDTMEENWSRLTRLIAPLTKFQLFGPDPGAFTLLAAQWTGSGFSVWQGSCRQEESSLRRWEIKGEDSLFLHAGAYHSSMPPLEGLEALSYDQLVYRSRDQVQYAIDKDTLRLKNDAHHNQTISGPIRTAALRVKQVSPLKDPAAP